LFAFAGCGDDDSGGGPTVDGPQQQADGGGGGADAAPTIDGAGGGDGFSANCGQPGDLGNSMGVGKYCDQAFGQCEAPASICAILSGDDTATFCTKICDGDMPDLEQCGEDATCACMGSNCGCTPNACLGL